MSEVTLPPVIVVTEPGRSGYMQKVKPQPLGVEEIHMVAMKMGADPKKVQAIILDDVMEDDAGARFPARRLVVTLHGTPVPEGAAAPDAPPKPAKKRAGRPRKAKAKPAADASAG